MRSSPLEPTSPTPRVLIVEDDDDTRDVLRFCVEKLGIEVRTAASGSEALAVASEWQPSLVLLDIGMPGMDGFEVARHLRKQATEPMQLVALTGYGRDSDRDRAQEAGFDDFILKGTISLFDAIAELVAPMTSRDVPGH